MTPIADAIAQTAKDVEAIRRTLSNGEYRLVPSPASLRVSWFPDFPSDSEQLLSDYSAGTPDPEISRDFEDEVRAFREFLEDGSPCRSGLDAIKLPPDADRFMSGLNRRAEAMSLWDRLAVPVRVKGNVAYRIWAPRDVFGTPIVHSVPLPLFVAGVCQKTAEDYVTILQFKEQLAKWRAGALILGVLLVISLLR